MVYGTTRTQECSVADSAGSGFTHALGGGRRSTRGRGLGCGGGGGGGGGRKGEKKSW